MTTLPAHLSPSQIASLNFCSAQYLLERTGHAEEDAAWFVRGSVVHEAIQHAIRSRASEDETIAYADRLLNESSQGSRPLRYTSRLPDWQTLVEQTHRAISAWFRSVHPDSPNRLPEYDALTWPPQTELRIQTDTRPSVHLYLDALFSTKENREPVLVDWKVGSSYKSNPLQLRLGWWALRHASIVSPRQPINAWYHHLLAPDGGRIQRVKSYPGDQTMWGKVRRADRTKRLGRFEPSPSPFCSACLVQSVCPSAGFRARRRFRRLIREAQLVEVGL